MKRPLNIEPLTRWATSFAALAVAAIIFALTEQPPEASSSLSGAVSSAILNSAEIAAPELTEPSSQLIKFVPGAVVIQPIGLGIGFRQLAHTIEFFTLGAFVATAERMWLCKLRVSSHLASAAMPVGICAVYSLFDQIHKLFVPGREFDAIDLGFDAMGYMAACALVFCIASLLHRKGQTTGNCSRL